MNNKLPKVYVNKIDKNLNINQESTISSTKPSNVDLDIILDDTNKYLFNHRYLITLKDNTTLEDSIISKKNDSVLTLEGRKIAINKIKNIIEISK